MVSICQICNKKINHKPSKNPKFCSILCKAKAQTGKKQYKIIFDNKKIKNLYLNEKISTLEIAKIMKTNKKIIRKRLIDMNIKLRTSGESKSLFLKRWPEKNPNNFPGIKEKQRQSQIELNRDVNYFNLRNNKRINGIKNMSLYKKNEWKDNLSKIKLKRTPQQIKDQLIKQYETKRKNGTFICSGLESKYKKILESKNIKYLPEYIIPEGNKGYRYDFYVPEEKMLYEINGTATHADPRRYKPNDMMKLGLPGWKPCTAKFLWKKDKEKRKYAEKYGYSVTTIWERDL